MRSHGTRGHGTRSGSGARLARLLAVLALTGSLGGCSAVTPDGGHGAYDITVLFARTPSLYKGSHVKIMGLTSGVISDIAIDRASERVKVTLRIPGDIPVPADARAAIVATTIIGERNVVLSPPWKPGMARMRPGAVIPQERTDLPVEIDDALATFTRLADSVDPVNLRRAVAGTADLLRGNGAEINAGLKTVGDLTRNLAAQDQRLVSLLTSLDRLAASLNERDGKLKALFAAFNDAGGMLADERHRLRGFLAGLESLVGNGDVLIQAYHRDLPPAVADLSELVMTLKADSAGIAESITALARLSDVVVKTWDREQHTVTLRVALNATTRTWLQPLFTAMGWGTVPCAGPPVGNCPDGGKGRREQGREQGKDGQ